MDIQEGSGPEVLPDWFVQKRIVQNLKGIDFDDDSDDDVEWTPTKIVLKLNCCLSATFCEFQTKYPSNLERHKQLHQNVKKRKNENTSSQKASLKKQKLDLLECDICKVTFTIKGNLTRNKRNKHK